MHIDIPLLESFSTRGEINEIAELIEFLKSQNIEVLTSIDIDAIKDDEMSFASIAYLDRFRKRLLDSGKFEAEEVNTIMKHARGYAGGVRSGEVRRSAGDEADSLAAHEGFYQMPSVVDVMSFSIPAGASMTPWMQITPKAGTSFKHPQYGTVAFTRAMADEMVANFQNNIYQEHIPIDSEHATKLSGALGYYRELRVRSDGAVEARIELTERGKALRTQGGLRYFSPEFFRSWTDPATSKEHKNLLVGGAFTTRPFFKDAHLAPLAASEQYSVITGGNKMERWKKDADGAFVTDDDGNPQLTDEAIAADKAAADTAAAAAVEAAERAAVAKFREANNLDENGKPIEPKVTKFSEQFPDEAQRFAEIEAENKRLKEGALRQQFREVALGRDPEGDGSKPFIGDVEGHVNFMVSLAEKFGEDSEQLTHYVSTNREHAEQVTRAGLFNERGSSGSSAARITDPEQRAEKMASDRLKSDPSKTFAEHLDDVIRENPGIYSEVIN